MLLRSGSYREDNKMVLPLPLSFPALRIFPSNAGRAAAGAGGRKLREDALLLGPFFFSATQESALFLSSLLLSIFCMERMAELGPFKSCLSLCSNQPHPLFESGWKECPPSSDKGMLPPTIKGKARRGGGDAAGEGKGFRRSIFSLFFIENEEGRGWPTVRLI